MFKYIFLSSIIIINTLLASIELSEEEKLWLEKNPVIKVHNERNWPPYNFNKNGKPLGFSIDYMNLVAQKSNINIEYVVGEWSELLQKTYDKELDVMLNIVKNSEREKHLLYANSYAKNITSLITRDDNKDIVSLESLKGKKISLVKGFFYEGYFRENHPEIEIVLTENALESLKAVLYKKADATFGKTIIMNYIMNENGISGLKFVGDFSTGDVESDTLNIAVRNDAPELQSIIKKAMALITQDEINQLRLKWFGENQEILSLSDEEKQWISKNIPVHYVYDPNWFPFEWKDDLGKHLGILSDLIYLIKERSGINFIEVGVDSWSDALKLFKDKKVDMFSGINETADKNKTMLFTNRSISKTPYVFVTRVDDKGDYFNTFNSLKDKRVAVVSGYSIENIILKNRPDIKLISLKRTEDGFKNLKSGDIDVFIINAVTAKYYIDRFNYKELHIATKIDYNLDLKIAIQKDSPKELLSILNKSIESISDRELMAIQHKWTQLIIAQKIDWFLVFEISVTIALVILIILLHNRKLKSLVDKKTADILKQKNELEILIQSFDKNVIFSRTDLDGNITHISEAFCEISGYTYEELIGKPHNIIRHPDMPKETFKEIWDALKKESCIVADIKNRKKQGQFYWVESKFEPDYDSNGVLIGYSAIRQNITDKKLVEEFSKNLENMVDIRTKEVEIAKEQLEEILKQTKSSIEYASLIQHSLIPEASLFRKFFSDYFTIWHPKDIVGGDIYLFEEMDNSNECIIMVIDCTGHGVSGAFITMLVKAIERQIISKALANSEEISPAKILQIFNKSMKHLLKQDNKDSISNAGFDGGILYYNKEKKIIKFAGAETPLFYIDENGELIVIRGDRHSIGYKKSDSNYKFKEHIIDVKDGMQFYITTDGYIDQNGGAKGFPFGKSNFTKIIKEYSQESFADQQEIFLDSLAIYQKDEIRNDDITLIGFKI